MPTCFPVGPWRREIGRERRSSWRDVSCRTFKADWWCNQSRSRQRPPQRNCHRWKYVDFKYLP